MTHREDLVYVVYSEKEFESYYHGELAIVDVSDPADPARLFSGFAWGPNQYGGFAATDIEEQDGYLYIAMDAVPEYRLRVVDVHEPSAPVDLGYVPGLSCRDLFVFGRYAYAIGADDVSARARPDRSRGARGGRQRGRGRRHRGDEGRSGDLRAAARRPGDPEHRRSGRAAGHLHDSVPGLTPVDGV